MNALRSTAAAVLALLCLTCVVFLPIEHTKAGYDKIAFPSTYQSGVLYTIADRSDLKEYREMWTSPEAIEAAKPNKPLPYGTVITPVCGERVGDARSIPLLDHNG